MKNQAPERAKRGRPSRGPVVDLHVEISQAVNRRFRQHIGPDRILARAVEQALVNEMKRGRDA